MEGEELIQTIKKIKKGDESAFKELFFAFQPVIFSFLYRYTYNYQIAEDLTQETFLNFWNSRERIDTSKSPKAYIFKIARNLAYNMLERSTPMLSIDGDSDLLKSAKFDPRKGYETNMLMKDLSHAIMKLPEGCRTIFILSRYHNFKYKEIADTLDISLQTVKNQMTKSLSLLRDSLSEHLD